uniref:Uncharacterized protein n=1 Tax=Kalanchoe fedtschenkoi TaxID=63787 RepID=A0A7N0SZX4_KALFE
MDSKEWAELGYKGHPPLREQETVIDPKVMESYNELMRKAREASQSQPESSQKNDEQVQGLVRSVHSRANNLLDWEEEINKRAEELNNEEEQLRKKAEGLNNEEEQLQKKGEELNSKEEQLNSKEEVRKKEVYKQDELLWSTEMLGLCRMNQESLQKLRTQVDSLDEEVGKNPSSSQSNAAAGMEMPRTTTALMIPQPATHSHSVVERGDHQGNRPVSSGAAMRPIVPAPLPACHSTQTVFIPCELRIQAVPLGAQPLVPAAYHSTGPTTPHPQAQMPQPDSGDGRGTSGSTGDRGKGKQHS